MDARAYYFSVYFINDIAVLGARVLPTATLDSGSVVSGKILSCRNNGIKNVRFCVL
jgi:hypothetical protein